MNLRFQIPNGDELEAPLEVWVAGLVSMLSEEDTAKLMRTIRIAMDNRLTVPKSNVLALPKKKEVQLPPITFPPDVKIG